MPRTHRLLSETGYYHVMIRGNEKRDIFLDNNDRVRFLDIIKAKKAMKNFSIIAYCLMNNHVHLILDEGPDGVSKNMHSINTAYAYYFNSRHSRIGHLFQDRFKSEAIEDDRYLLTAVRYIHNNPINAGITFKPEDYKWSSYQAYANPTTHDGIVDRKLVLSLFADDEKKAISAFRDFSHQACTDTIIDISYESPPNKSIFSATEAMFFINEYLDNHDADINQLYKDKPLRNDLIRELRNRSTLSIREMAVLLSLDRNLIQRA